ncbi:MAG: TetR/AcrR family transcriptional regulator [Hyphomicrobiaceae bacterium]|nr:TetR/AcrR family transcriptional regulator [Hyphomicrobiaceae bacterium]
MGRRSVHTPEELREHILNTATELISTSGLTGLSAREVARRIGYSAGTIYNVFKNLDDLILTIEERMLDELDASLNELPHDPDPRKNLLQLAEAYLAFTHKNPLRWNLLFEHHLPQGMDVPAQYQAKLDGLLSRIENALQPIANTSDEAELKRRARVLWAGVHGITSLSTAGKLSSVTTETAAPLVRDLVQTYIDGLNTR